MYGEPAYFHCLGIYNYELKWVKWLKKKRKILENIGSRAWIFSNGVTMVDLDIDDVNIYFTDSVHETGQKQ